MHSVDDDQGAEHGEDGEVGDAGSSGSLLVELIPGLHLLISRYVADV